MTLDFWEGKLSKGQVVVRQIRRAVHFVQTQIILPFVRNTKSSQVVHLPGPVVVQTQPAAVRIVKKIPVNVEVMRQEPAAHMFQSVVQKVIISDQMALVHRLQRVRKRQFVPERISFGMVKLVKHKFQKALHQPLQTPTLNPGQIWEIVKLRLSVTIIAAQMLTVVPGLIQIILGLMMSMCLQFTRPRARLLSIHRLWKWVTVVLLVNVMIGAMKTQPSVKVLIRIHPARLIFMYQERITHHPQILPTRHHQSPTIM